MTKETKNDPASSIINALRIWHLLNLIDKNIDNPNITLKEILDELTKDNGPCKINFDNYRFLNNHKSILYFYATIVQPKELLKIPDDYKKIKDFNIPESISNLIGTRKIKLNQFIEFLRHSIAHADFSFSEGVKKIIFYDKKYSKPEIELAMKDLMNFLHEFSWYIINGKIPPKPNK